MPEIVPLEAKDRMQRSHPPAYFLTFTKEEFPSFLADPVGTMNDLGQPVKNLTVAVKDHVWDSTTQEWITDQSDQRIVGMKAQDLPTAQHWVWWCGYQDEMCVCERVLGDVVQ